MLRGRPMLANGVANTKEPIELGEALPPRPAEIFVERCSLRFECQVLKLSKIPITWESSKFSILKSEIASKPLD